MAIHPRTKKVVKGKSWLIIDYSLTLIVTHAVQKASYLIQSGALSVTSEFTAVSKKPSCWLSKYPVSIRVTEFCELGTRAIFHYGPLRVNFAKYFVQQDEGGTETLKKS